jgi:hypothetical protein
VGWEQVYPLLVELEAGARRSPGPHSGSMSARKDLPSSWRELGPLLLAFLPAAALAVLSDAPALSIALWWSLACAPAGALAGGLRPRAALWPLASWAGVALWLALSPNELLPRAPWAVAACASLFLVGAALGRAFGWSSLAAAGLLWLVAGLLVALPSGAGALARPWPPELTAAFLDLSPQVWVFEVGGFDWLRHPAVYERAGAADLGPDLRVPWLPASSLWALGAGLLLLGTARLRGRATPT